MTATIAQQTACPRCSSTERQVSEVVFKDGSRHDAERCAGCGRHWRYLPRNRRGEIPHVPQRQVLPLAPARRPAPASTGDVSGSKDRTFEAMGLLKERVAEVGRRLKGEGLDLAMWASLQGGCLAAAACLESENLNRRAAKLRNEMRTGLLAL